MEKTEDEERRDNSSDSGSGGIIDVSNISSSGSNVPSPYTNGACTYTNDEDKKNAGILKQSYPISAEKVWFTDTSTGVWLMEEEQGDCEVPNEFLDVSLESEEEACDGCSNDDEDRQSNNDNDGTNGPVEETDGEKVAIDQPQLCGWVPPQCCLIPLPSSPTHSGDEGEGGGGEVGNEGSEEGGELTEAELQRQNNEKELEVLFGYKPSHVSDTVSSSGESAGGEEVNELKKQLNNDNISILNETDKGLIHTAARNADNNKPRSNSTDSGVASISPHSESDMEQRSIQNRMGTAGDVKEDNQIKISPDTNKNNNKNSLSDVDATPDLSSKKLHSSAVSRLKTPSEKCSVFTASPVICSELEELKEAFKMVTILPFPQPPTLSNTTSLTNTITHETSDGRNQTFTLTSPPTSTTAPPGTTSHTTLTEEQTSSSSSSSYQHDQFEREGSMEKSGDNISVSSSVNSVAASSTTGVCENSQQINTKKIGKKTMTMRFGKPIARGTFAYKAGTGAPPVKMVKKPPSKLKSLLPAATKSGQSFVLPSQMRRPDTKRRATNPDSQPPPPPPAPSQSDNGPVFRRSSGTITTNGVRSSGLMQPGKKILRKCSDPGPLKASKTFAKPSNPNPIREMTTSSKCASKLTVVTTPTRHKIGVMKESNPSTPTRPLRGNVKQPLNNAKSKRPSITAKSTQETMQTSSNKSTSTGLSTSIVSNCSPSVQQSTPLKKASHSSVAAKQTATVVKAVNTTVTKESSATQHSKEEKASTIPITPRSSIESTPSRRVRPKFSLSSIGSEYGSTHQPPPTTVGQTFTHEEPNQHVAVVQSTPRSSYRKERRSFIPTPSRQDNRDVIPLVYGTDSKSSQHIANSPVSSRVSGDTGGASMYGGGKRKMNPRSRRPLVARNRMMVGPNKKPTEKGQEGPLKPLNVYKYSSKVFDENEEPPVPTAKIVHSPIDKEDKADSPHSAWSPIRRKPIAGEDACFKCTKRGYRDN